MVDFPDYSLDELKKILANLKGEPAVEAQRESVGVAEELARQAKQAQQPLGQMGEVLNKEAAQSAVQSPADLARKAAQSKLDAAAKGSVGEGVITSTPPTRQFEAMEKIKNAAKGTMGDDVITNMPTSSGMERMASAEELAGIGSKAHIPAPAAVEAPMAPVAKTSSSFLDNLLAKVPMDRINQFLGKSVSAPSMAEVAADAKNIVYPMDAARVAGNASLSAGDAVVSGLGKAGLSGASKVLKIAGSAPFAAATAFLDPTETQVAPGEDNAEAVAKRMRESLTPEDQAKVAAFSKELEMKRLAGMLPYQQQTQMAENQQTEEQKEEKAKQSLGLGRAGQLAKPGELPRLPASAETAPAPTESIMAGFAQAQQGANEGTLAGQLGKAGSLIGSGIVGTTSLRPTETHDKIFDTNIAIAQQIPEQYKQKIEMSRLDPASDISVSARGFIKSALNIAVPDNVSAHQLKEQFPVIEKLLQAREAAAVRQAIAQERQNDRDADREFKEKALKLRETAQGNRAVGEIQRDPILKQTSQRIQNLDKAIGIINAKEPLTAQLLSDVEQDMLSAITGSATPAVAKLNKIEFKSLQRDAAKVQQYLKNGPIDLRTAAPDVVKAVTNSVNLLKKAYEHDKLARMGELVDQKLPLYEGNHDRIAGVLKGLAKPVEKTQTQTPSATVKIRDKKTGVVKTLSSDKAQKYLANPGFEEVK